jgi:hypothetical protein
MDVLDELFGNKPASDNCSHALHSDVYEQKSYAEWLEERRAELRDKSQTVCDWGFRAGSAGLNTWLGMKKMRSLPLAGTGFGAAAANTGIDLLLFRDDHIRNAERSFTVAADFLVEPMVMILMPGAMWKRATAMVGVHTTAKICDRLFKTQLETRPRSPAVPGESI